MWLQCVRRVAKRLLRKLRRKLLKQLRNLLNLSDKKIIVGKLFSAHDIKGAVKYASYTENPDTLFALKPLYCGEKEVRLKKAGNGIVSIEGVSDRNAAELLRNQELWVWRSQLPEPDAQEYYIEDLIGLAVFSDEGEALGQVLAFHHYGAGDIMEIGLKGQKTELIGFEMVERVDLAGGRVIVSC